MSKPSRIVIVGAGFGGLQTAYSLARADVEVILIDRNPYHTFVPLLYQVATATLEPEQTVVSLRQQLQRLPNAKFVQADVKRVDFAQKQVMTLNERIPYDFLVLATGSRTQYLGVPGAADYALPLRSLDQAIALHNHVLACVQQAAQERNPSRRQALLTFVVVGGGATGVEMAGALTELIHEPLKHRFPSLDLRQVRIILIQSQPRLLINLPPPLGDYTRRHLHRMGVEIYLQTKVSRVTPAAVELDDGTRIATASTLWAAGTEAAAPALVPQAETAAKDKLVTQPTLQLVNHPQVYVAGDLADVEAQGRSLPALAPVALQQGVCIARNIQRQLRGQQPKPFRYFNKGRLAIIARYAGVGKVGGFNLTGGLPWLLWLGVHWVYLPGWRNRGQVLRRWLLESWRRDRPVQPLPTTRPSTTAEFLQSVSKQ